MDRWLLSEPFDGPDEGGAQAPYLPAAADTGFFPDRDVEVGGAYWRLVREDGASAFDLDSLLGDPARPAVAWAHTYLRAPSDRTVRLSWRAAACGGTELRLNAQPLPEAAPGSGDAGPEAPGSDGVRTAVARLAGGWNTLLVRVEAGEDCPLVLGAWIEGVEGPRPEEDDLRVQASRPPGVHRTYPAAAVTLSPPRVPNLTWEADAEDVAGVLAFEATAWGAPEGTAGTSPGEAERPGAEGEDAGREPRTPPRPAAGRPRPGAPPPGRPPGERPAGAGAGGAPQEDPEPADPRARRAALRDRLLGPPPPPEPAPDTAAMEAEAGGYGWERFLRLPPPARPLPVSDTLPFRALREAALSERGIRVLLRWRVAEEDRERRVERPVSADETLRALHRPIPLAGWRNRESGAARAASGGEGPGVRFGEWRVPRALAGFGLELLADGAPGAYRLDGERVRAGEGLIPVLCSPCREGRVLRLEVEPGAEWTDVPRVRIVEAGYPAAGAGAPPAATWLRALDEEDKEEYLELSRRHAPPGRGAPDTAPEGGTPEAGSDGRR